MTLLESQVRYSKKYLLQKSIYLKVFIHSIYSDNISYCYYTITIARRKFHFGECLGGNPK